MILIDYTVGVGPCPTLYLMYSKIIVHTGTGTCAVSGLSIGLGNDTIKPTRNALPIELKIRS